jgi:hypothetical protein
MKDLSLLNNMILFSAIVIASAATDYSICLQRFPNFDWMPEKSRGKEEDVDDLPAIYLANICSQCKLQHSHKYLITIFVLTSYKNESLDQSWG